MVVGRFWLCFTFEMPRRNKGEPERYGDLSPDADPGRINWEIIRTAM